MPWCAVSEGDIDDRIAAELPETVRCRSLRISETVPTIGTSAEAPRT
jgi:hypothetical protein